jgi:inner membrane protein
MASAFTHAVVALTIGQASYHVCMNRRALWLGAICSVVPDIDVVGLSFGIAYGDLWGHRGVTHSLFFAAALSAALVGCCYRGEPKAARAGIGWYLFLCTASHGMLDALTDGGLGVAFFAPFDPTRYFFPVRPVLVSPIGVEAFFSGYGLRVLASEAQWIWLPSLALFLVLRALNVRRSARAAATDRPR